MGFNEITSNTKTEHAKLAKFPATTLRKKVAVANKKGVNTSKTSMETGYNGFLSIFIISRGREIIQSSKNSKYLYKRNVIQFDGMGNLELKDRRANETLIQYLKQIDEEGIIANAPIVWTDKTSNTKHSCSLIPVEVSSLSALPVEERRNSKLPFACLVFEELGLNVQLCKAELQENFGLTNAEIELAEGLFTGKDICQIAEEKGITKNTIRERLKKVFMKTGTNRQAALVRMLRLFAK